MNSEKEQAKRFCKYLLARPFFNNRRLSIMSAEGGFNGMVDTCLSFIWEAGSTAGGIEKYYQYFSAEYSPKLYKNKEVYLSEIERFFEGEESKPISSRNNWSTLGAYDNILERGEEPDSGGSFGGTPSGSTSFGGLSSLKSEDGVTLRSEWYDYVAGLSDKTREILETWAAVRSNSLVAELCDVTVGEVRRAYQNAKRKSYRVLDRVGVS